MNKVLYNFPKANPIKCIWIKTGDPKNPLMRVWTDGAVETTEVEGLRLCA